MKEQFIETPYKSDKEFVLECPPVYTLKEILALKPVSDLRKLCSFSDINGLNKMKKDKLILVSYEILTDEEEFREILYGMEEKMWEFLKILVDNKHIEYNKLFPEEFYNMRYFGTIQIFHYDNKQYIVVPEEIKSIYRNIVDKNFLKTKSHYNMIERYAIAAANLYKIISYDDLASIYNSQNKDQTDAKDLFDILSKHHFSGKGYCLFEKHIISEDYESLTPENLDDFDEITNDIPRYVPKKEELLKYMDERYYEITPEILALKDFIKKIVTEDEELIESYLENIVFFFRDEEDPQDIFKAIKSFGLDVSYNHIHSLGRHLADVANSTRFWSRKGHTLNEVFASKKKASNFKVIKGDKK